MWSTHWKVWMFSLYVRFSRVFGGVTRCISQHAHTRVGCLNCHARPCNYNKSCKTATLAVAQQGLCSRNASSTLSTYSVWLGKRFFPKITTKLHSFHLSLFFLFLCPRREKRRFTVMNEYLDSIYSLTKHRTSQLQRKQGTFFNFVFSSLNQK